MQSSKTLDKEKLKQMLPQAKQKDEKLGYFFGPLPLKKSTKELSLLVRALLDEKASVNFSVNSSREMIATALPSTEFNLTKILADEPNLDHIALVTEELDVYLKYLTSNADPEAYIKLSAEGFIENEEKEGIDPTLLHLSEKYALNIYSSDYYKKINPFLRTDGRSLIDLNPLPQEQIKTILLTTIVANGAITKLPAQQPELSFRVDTNLPKDVLNKRIKQWEEYKIIHEKAFYSSSEFEKKSSFDTQPQLGEGVFHLTINSSSGKAIKAYSEFSDEEEVLYSASTQFFPLAYENVNNAHYFIHKPVVALRVMPSKEKIRATPIASTGLSLFSRKNLQTGLLVTAGVVTMAGLCYQSKGYFFLFSRKNLQTGLLTTAGIVTMAKLYHQNFYKSP